jgi:hypothetical protein
MGRPLIALPLLAILAGCTESRSTLPSAPSPTPPSANAVYTLSGTVFESTANGIRPVPDATISQQLEVSPGSFYGTHVKADGEGRYVIGDLPHGVKVALRVHRHLWGQPAPADAVMTSNQVLDIELVPPGERSRNPASPRLSGVVYEMTPTGPVPAVHARLYYTFNCRGVTLPMYTGPDGRYEFSRLPSGLGCVEGSITENGAEDPRAFGTGRIVVAGDTVLDITLASTAARAPF